MRVQYSGWGGATLRAALDSRFRGNEGRGALRQAQGERGGLEAGRSDDAVAGFDDGVEFGFGDGGGGDGVVSEGGESAVGGEEDAVRAKDINGAADAGVKQVRPFNNGGFGIDDSDADALVVRESGEDIDLTCAFGAQFKEQGAYLDG